MKICDYCKASEKETRVIRTKKFGDEMILCDAHYYQMVKKGKMRHKRTDFNEIIEHDDFIEMHLYDKLGNVIESAYFSKEHLEAVSKHRWSLNKKINRDTSYADTRIDGRSVKFHTLIANIIFGEIPNGDSVDHINRNGLDNRNENLRYATKTEQNINQKLRKDNSSGIKGVCFCKKTEKWISQLKHKEHRFKNVFDSFEDAVLQRKEWEYKRDLGELD